MLLRSYVVFLLSFFCACAHADFNYVGKGKLRFPTGTETDLEFPLAATKINTGFSFKVGQQELEVAQVPEKYSIWFSMNKAHEVYVQEFASTYLQEFELQLGEYDITLKKKVLKPKPAKGDYVLSINNLDYFFTSNQGQIDILMNEEGIVAIEANGFAKDLGLSE